MLSQADSEDLLFKQSGVLALGSVQTSLQVFTRESDSVKATDTKLRMSDCLIQEGRFKA